MFNILKIFQSKEEILYNKIIKNEPNEVNSELLEEIKEIETNLITAQKFTDIIFEKLDKEPFLPNQYFRLLISLFTLMKCDTTNSFVLQCLNESIQMILYIPQQYRSDEENELMVSFANHIDFYINLHSEDFSVLESELCMEELIQQQSDEQSEKTLINLILMFKNLIIIHWDYSSFYSNQLHFQILSLLLKEMITIFYRICLHLFLFVQSTMQSPSTSPVNLIKILKMFDECQESLQNIFNTEYVKQHFKKIPSISIEMTLTLRELFSSRFKLYKFSSNEITIKSTSQSNSFSNSHFHSNGSRNLNSSQSSDTSENDPMKKRTNSISPIFLDGSKTPILMGIDNYEIINDELKNVVHNFMNYLINQMNKIYHYTYISFDTTPPNESNSPNNVNRLISPDFHFGNENLNNENSSNESSLQSLTINTSPLNDEMK